MPESWTGFPALDSALEDTGFEAPEHSYAELAAKSDQELQQMVESGEISRERLAQHLRNRFTNSSWLDDPLGNTVDGLGGAADAFGDLAWQAGDVTEDYASDAFWGGFDAASDTVEATAETAGDAAGNAAGGLFDGLLGENWMLYAGGGLLLLAWLYLEAEGGASA